MLGAWWAQRMKKMFRRNSADREPGLLAVLDPDVVRRADLVAVPSGAATELRGATAIVDEALTHTDLARSARPSMDQWGSWWLRADGYVW
jgi:hypothetical protein